MLLQFKNISFCFIYCHGRVRELLSFLEASGNRFLRYDLQKKKKLPQTLRKFTATIIGDNLSITDIALKN